MAPSTKPIKRPRVKPEDLVVRNANGVVQYRNAPPRRNVPKKLMIEKGGLRGLVPTSTFGKDDGPYNAYLERIDPKTNQPLKEALAGSNDKRFQAFLARLGTDRYKRYSMAALAKSCDIPLPMFQEFYNKAQTQRAIAIAQESLPNVTSAVVGDALSKLVTCPRCDGYRVVECRSNAPGARALNKTTFERDCPMCKGRGEIDQSGSRESQKILLETTGLLNKRSPMIAINNNNFGGMGIESAVDKLNSVGFDLGDGEVIDIAAEPSGPEESFEETQ